MEDPGPSRTFAEALAGDPLVAVARVRDGRRLLKQVEETFERLLEVLEAFSKQSAQEAGRRTAGRPMVTGALGQSRGWGGLGGRGGAVLFPPGSASHLWYETCEQIEAQHSKALEMCVEFRESIAQAKKWAASSKATRINIEVDLQKSMKDIQHSANALAASQTQLQRSIKAADRTKIMHAKLGSGNGREGISRVLHEAARKHTIAEQAHDDQATQHHQSCQAASSTVASRLSTLESLEHKRVQHVKQLCIDFLSLQSAIGQLLHETAEKALLNVSQIDPEADKMEFLHHQKDSTLIAALGDTGRIESQLDAMSVASEDNLTPLNSGMPGSAYANRRRAASRSGLDSPVPGPSNLRIPPPPGSSPAITRSRSRSTAVFEYVAQSRNELSFQEGEEIRVVGTESEDGWVLAENAHGEQGYIPAAYIEGAGAGRVQSVRFDL